MSQFDNIRPYNDGEVRPTLDRILASKELHQAMARLVAPRLSKLLPLPCTWATAWYLKRQLAGINCVREFQAVVASYMDGMIARTSDGIEVVGLDKLDPKQSYLFVSNHRDIAMDPAFINWALFHNGFDTVRIAIGDNLLTKPYVSDLMRLNKSFIVERSATAPREKLRAAKHLSAYIHHSVTEEKSNTWIAQREGRAKDGLDRTNTAVVGMFALNKPKQQDFSEYIRELNIVPVSISYELDPCDNAKAREVYHLQAHGGYDKDEHEDVQSIAKGITGRKGTVTVVFGEPLQGDFENTDAVAAEIDRQVIVNYQLRPSNFYAYNYLHGYYPALEKPFDPEAFPAQKAEFDAHLAGVDDRWRNIFLAMYANPIESKLEYK